MNLYEGLFLLNSVEAKRDWEGICGHVREQLEKHGAEVLKEVQWDDRRLAYEVAGQKRGTYLLVFFKLDGQKIAPLRRDCQLSERILRQLFVRHQGDEVPAYAAAGPARPERGRHERGRPSASVPGKPEKPAETPTPTPSASDDKISDDKVPDENKPVEASDDDKSKTEATEVVTDTATENVPETPAP